VEGCYGSGKEELGGKKLGRLCGWTEGWDGFLETRW
jgi:hypothetical protein